MFARSQAADPTAKDRPRVVAMSAPVLFEDIFEVVKREDKKFDKGEPAGMHMEESGHPGALFGATLLATARHGTRTRRHANCC